MNAGTLLEHRGGCHCGRVRFRVRTPPRPTVYRCNCSMCRRMGYLHLIVPRSAFTLEMGAKHLQSYRFGTRVAEHLFCRTCGIQSFYVPRSNPDGISVHVGCLDAPLEYDEVPFDGRSNWGAHAARVAHLSRQGDGDEESEASSS